MSRGLYPISGIKLTPNGRLRRSGYYHGYTHELFKPIWWPKRVSNISKSILEQTVYDRDAARAFPIPRFNSWKSAYRRNELRYLRPALNCNDLYIQEYLLNTLEPSYRKTFSGIGMGSSLKYEKIRHIKKLADSVNRGAIDFNCDSSEPCSEIKSLMDLVKESDVWSNIRTERTGSQTPFPHVYENISIIKTLQIRDIKYVRSNHRMMCRRHPIWMHRKYYRFLEKSKFRRKLEQIAEENAKS